MVTLNGGVTTTTTTALSLDSGTTGGISIGTGSNAKIITVGNATGTTGLNFTSGTASQAFTSSATTGTGASSAFVFNASFLTSGTALRLTSVGTSGILFDQNATNTSGTIDRLAYGGATALTGTTTGLSWDFNTNVTATGITLTGASLTTAGDTNIDSATKKGLTITSGAITQNTAASTGNYIGLDMTMPALTLTSGTALNGNGIRVTTDGLTQTAGILTENGFLVDSTNSTITTGGTLNGLKINAPTTIPSVGTYNNIFLGTSTGATANTLDKATIAVGNIASTAQNNFATLNITNGGTGFLDMELLHGFMNTQGINTLSDDFTGRVLDTTNTWVSTVTGGATSCGFLAGGLNGLLRLTTGNAASRGCELTTQTITTLTNGYYQAGNNPIFETRLRIDTLTNARINVGFTDTRVAVASDSTVSSNHAYIGKKAADTTWQCITDDDGVTETTADTGVTIVANTFYRLRVELRNGTTPEAICTVDDGATVTRTVVTTHLPLTTGPMDVYVRDNQSDAIVKNMDVDYVRAWQDDPVGLAVLGSSVKSPADTPTISPTVTIPITPVIEASASATLSASFDSQFANSISNIFQHIIEFFGNVIFHKNVTFLDHTTFSKDTAGHAVIKAGQKEVTITYQKPYELTPVVTANINLSGSVSVDTVPAYAIYDSNAQGFTIELAHPMSSDLNFSWIALAISPDDPVAGSSASSSLISPLPTLTPLITPLASSSAKVQ